MKNLLKKIEKIPLQARGPMGRRPNVYKDFPESPGIYIYSQDSIPIYVGKAINLKRRVASYFRINLEVKTRRMMEEAQNISYIKVGNELEALLLEAKLIKLYQPKYNIIAKDDKHPLYIQITKDQYPIIKTVRKNDLNQAPNLATYGPFPSSTNVRSVLKMIRRIFPFADHKIGKKACLYSQIGLCNPCPNEINNNQDPIGKQIQISNYKNNIRHVKSLLDGKIDYVKSELQKEMDNNSKNQKYEDALAIRNKIHELEYITKESTNVDEYLENPNLGEDIRDGEIKELGKILKSFKLLTSLPKRIECYDIAHLQGTHATASMITFVNGEPEKQYYRHFRIRQSKGNDDYASMKEVAERRKKHFADWGRPDLIIVDGGKGQLSMFKKTLETEGIPIIGLAKRFETLIIPTDYLGTATFREHRLPRGHALHLVQRMRNEAHRFARVYHHKLFKSSLFESKD